MEILDTGNRREFDTGAKRDMADGKGRFDLMPLDIVSDISELIGTDKGFYFTLLNIANYQENGNTECLQVALHNFIDYEYDNYYEMLLELAKHFENGAKKYGEYNWQKGIPTSSYIDSACRHLTKVYANWNDENHKIAFVWNMICLLWTIKHKEEVVTNGNNA